MKDLQEYKEYIVSGDVNQVRFHPPRCPPIHPPIHPSIHPPIPLSLLPVCPLDRQLPGGPPLKA